MSLSINPISSNRNQTKKSQNFGNLIKLDLRGLGGGNANEVATRFVVSEPVQRYIKMHNLAISSADGKLSVADPKTKLGFNYPFERKTFPLDIDKKAKEIVDKFNEVFYPKRKRK